MTKSQERRILIPKLDEIYSLIKPGDCPPDQLRRFFADRFRLTGSGYELRLTRPVFYINDEEAGEWFRIGEIHPGRTPEDLVTPGGLAVSLYSELTPDGIIRAYTRASNIHMRCAMERMDALRRRGG